MEPNPASVLTADIATTTAFVWLLHTARGEVGNIVAEILENNETGVRIRIGMPDKQTRIVMIPVDGHRAQASYYGRDVLLGR